MKPKANTEQCELLAFLLDDGRWHKGRTLRMNHRMIRAACAAEPDRFLSSQSGYKLVQFASIAEIDIAVADLRSRIVHIRGRAEALEQARCHRFAGMFDITRQGQLL